MKLRVNQHKCVGSGQCARTLPEVFDQREHDGIVLLLAETPPAPLELAVRKAARLCPSQAIIIEES